MKTQKAMLSISVCALGFFLILALAASSSNAQQILSYQGEASSNGTPMQGSHSVTISIYTDSTGGTAIYQETESGVIFANGLFNVSVGSNKSLPLFDAGSYNGTPRPAGDYFLGVSIDGGAGLRQDRVLARRQRRGAANLLTLHALLELQQLL